jgi:hypothetical protein
MTHHEDWTLVTASSSESKISRTALSLVSTIVTSPLSDR